MIHVDKGRVDTLYRFSHRYYRKFNILKANGNWRPIRQPRKDLKAIQAWILRNILDKLNPSAYATAYIRKKNLLNNVSPHIQNRYFVLLDLEDFFPSVSVRRVSNIFALIGYSRKASSVLAQLCTCDGNLPQGAVTSPALSNLVAAKLDRRIAGYTGRRNVIYTRYSDDIALSSNNPQVLCQSLPRVIKIIKSEHFRPNMEKLRVLGPRRNCLVTGLVKDSSKPKFGIGKRKKREMRAIMHRLAFNLGKDKKYGSKESVEGWLSYLRSVDRQSFEQMNEYWNRLRQRANAP